MASKKTVIIFSILITYSISLLATDFEGRIILSKQSLYDTTIYEYTVKENHVRIDIKNPQAQIVQSLIIDLEEESITALSPNLRLYTTLKKNSYAKDYDKAEYELIKTPNFKLINGYKCFLWHVRNKRQDSDITFWITELKFDFLPKVVALLSRTDDYNEIINYYIQIELDNNFFPMLIIDRTLLQEEKSKLMVTDILNEPVSDKAFEISKDYKLLRY
ncbi:MAG TPA: DUF4412 domain-containing protein [Bacteroidales bacterium]|nr:DUF4412 domain-containing protein [Bacteroidales bacterium]